MFEYLANDVNDLFDILNEPIDSMFKITAIINFKNKYKIKKNVKIGEFCTEHMENKERGAVFTPLEIADYLIINSIKASDIIKNPYIKILDPSCGSGNILIPLFLYLKDIYKKNIQAINSSNNLELRLQDIERHIIDNNIFGFDLDEFSLKILKTDLFYFSSYINEKNIRQKDYLLSEEDEKFHMIIGNPPYIGHKTVSSQYSGILKKKYAIYKDKGDVSYCFFEKALQDLTSGGTLTYITSRYFMEAPSGEILRRLIKDQFSIEKIVDFYGFRPFKGKGIDTAILFLKKSMEQQDTVNIIRPRNYQKADFLKGLILNDENTVNKYDVSMDSLQVNGWSLIEPKKKKIIDKIYENTFITLSNISRCHQGVITGLDKAFVINSKEGMENKIESSLIKRWIKSSQISKCNIDYKNMNLIYTSGIRGADYPNAIKYLKPYKEILERRRECRNGVRAWYELQWGREEKNFTGEKIVFPYKASSNRFAIDKGSFHSADIYGIKLKENVPFTYKYLISILNSKTYEFYFKTFAKKLGGDMYDYYPNNLMKLSIPTMPADEVGDDLFLYKYFGFTEGEINIIENMNI
ncbi:MAG: N-6 DNA methylase [Bacillota bacterium]|nr:N-6 DNA methylase [Bacillota bacterium]